MRKFVFTLLLASFVVATCAILSAQDSDEFTVESARDLAVVPREGVKRALLIATGRHLNKKIAPLAGVDPDVDLIRERLLDPRCGFQDENVKVLKTDDFPTLEDINEAVDRFLNSCGSDDFAFLFLAGHGVRDPKEKVDYYVPFDAKPIIENGKITAFASDSCFSLKTLRDKIERCDAKFKWVVVDACRANLDARGNDDDWNSIGELEAAEGSLWFQSCGKGQKSYEIGFPVDGKVVNHGLFTWYFCQGAEGAAANNAGLVSPIGLLKYARRKMREAREKDRNIPEQEPLMSCQDLSDGEFVFVDVSDPDKVKAKKAFDEACQFFLDGEYKKAQTPINTAVKLDPRNETYKAWKKRIDELAGGGGNTPPPKPLPLDYLAPNGAEYRLIKAGSFTMGSEDCYNATPHKVTLTQDFYLGKHPVTRGEFKRFVEATGYKTTAEKEGSAFIFTKGGSWDDVKGASWKNPGFEQTDSHPVVCVSYDDALAYVAWLNKSSKPEEELNGFKPTYRLPTEAEWEYACCAGTKTEFFWGDDEKDGKGYLNAAGTEKNLAGETWNSHFSFDDGYSATSPVGSFKSNPWGLYDMLGNVWEWASDWYGDYPNGSVTDPKGAVSGSYRALRGGGWSDVPAYCRRGYRSDGDPARRYAYYGMRVACSLTK